MLLHPKVAALSCADCQKYDVSTDFEIVRRPHRVGLPVLRPRGVPAPCSTCPKPQPEPGEKPSWRNAVELSEQSVRVLVHYRKCRATGRFPDDPLVAENAALVRGIEDAAAENRQAVAQQQTILTILGSLFGRKE